MKFIYRIKIVIGILCVFLHVETHSKIPFKQYRQSTFNVTLWRLRKKIVTMETEQRVLFALLNLSVW